MINYLMGCTRQTQIGLLPDIINHNNSAITGEFEYIFDSSLNRLTKSLYAPTGSVKAHFGEFVNLSAEYVTIKNLDSITDTIYKAVNQLSHNALNSRFDSSNSSLYINTSFCHDASIIAYNSSYSVYQAIDNVNSNVSNLIDYIDSNVSIKLADVSALAHTTSNDVKDISIYVHGIESKIDDISTAAWNANRDTQNLSTYVHSIESQIDDISAKAKNAYQYAYDVSVLVHNSEVDQIPNVSTVAHNALNLANSNNSSIVAINTSIADHQETIDKLSVDLNSAVIAIKDNIKNINIANSSITSIKQDVLNVSVNLDSLSAQVSDLSTNMVNLKNANFQITYNSSTYQLSDIVQILDWKNSLTEETIQVTTSSGVTKMLTVLCAGSSLVVPTLNLGLNQLIGETSSISNPEDYTDQDVADASNHFNSIL